MYASLLLSNDTSTEIAIVLMGDSVLDNFYWLKDKRLDITQQLRNGYKYNNNVTIVNIAVDETETFNLVNDYGIKPKQKYIEMRNELEMQPYPMDNITGKVHSLKLLQDIITSYNHNSDVFVILSVGGNDFRILLALKSANKIIRTLQKRKFEENVSKIIHRLKVEMKVNVILVMCYSPKWTVSEFLGFPVNDFDFLVHWAYDLMLKIGLKYNVPIIDLHSTFDKFDSSYYSSISPIEPSNKSGQLITNLIMFCVKDIIQTQRSNKCGIEKSKTYHINPNDLSHIVSKQNDALFQHIDINDN